MNYRQRVKIERRRNRKHLAQMLRHDIRAWLRETLFERPKV